MGIDPVKIEGGPLSCKRG